LDQSTISIQQSTISIQQSAFSNSLPLLDTMPPARFLSGSPWLAWHCTCSRSQ
jgi:hypothetical protein